MKLLKSEHVGQKECFCVSTDTGHYELNGLQNHNSVTVQNFIQHAIEHNDEVALALCDPKVVEFSNYKGMKGIVGVANTTEETVELLRIARLVMYKRNRDLAKLGCKQVSEYTPTKRTGKCFVCGREYNDNDIIKIREDGVEKTMTASELCEYLASE